jgi:hypothetical protein
MAESAFDEFGRKLAGDFGVSIAKPADADFGNSSSGGSDDAPSKLGYSPELKKALDDIAKNGKMSDETRRLLLDLQNKRKAQAATGSY